MESSLLTGAAIHLSGDLKLFLFQSLGDGAKFSLKE